MFGMVSIFILSILTALAVVFIWSTLQEGMVFGIVQEKLYFLPDIIKKPLFDCIICMTPWYGGLFLFLVSIVLDISLTVLWIPLISAAGLNVILSPIIYKLHDLD